MGILFADNTALEFWRWHNSVGNQTVCPRMSRIKSAPDKSLSPNEIAIAAEDFYRLNSRLEVLVSSKNGVRKSAAVRYLIFSGELPSRSIYTLWRDVYTLSPELAFVRMAGKLDLVGAIKLGYEITSEYMPASNDVRGFSKCQPLTSLESLKRYIESANGIYGLQNAKRALPHIAACSRSPRETVLSMLLSLPKNLGGYGLPKPLLNQPIKIEEESHLGAFRSKVIPDLAWPKQKFAIEYESDEWHAGQGKFIEDSKRRNDIHALGYDVTTVTNDEIKSIAGMDKIAEIVRMKLRLRKTVDPRGYITKKQALRDMLI